MAKPTVVNLVEGDKFVSNGEIPTTLTRYGAVVIIEDTREIIYASPYGARGFDYSEWEVYKPNVIAYAERVGGVGILCYFISPSWDPHRNSYSAAIRRIAGSPRYLSYLPLSLRHTPVNPLPYAREWKESLSRAAHEIDMYHRSHHDTSNSSYIRERFEILVGEMWRKVLEFEVMEKNPTVAETDATHWKSVYASISPDVERFCIECDGAYFVRQWTRRASVGSFNREEVLANAIDQSRPHKYYWPNKSGTGKWTTGDVAINVPAAEWTAWKASRLEKFWEAVDYYDDEIAEHFHHTHPE